MDDGPLGFTPIPASAYDPAQPGAAFSPADFYKAYINGLISMKNQGGAGDTIIGAGDTPVIGAGGQELFDTGVFKPGTDLGNTSGWNQLGMTMLEAPGDKFWVEPAGGGTPTFLDPSSMLSRNEQQQLSSFMGEKSNHGAFGEFTEMAPQFAEIAAFLGSAGTAGSVLPVVGSIAGTLVGQKLGGPTGEQIGGLVGGAAGGGASGLTGSAATDASIAAEAGNSATGGAGGLEAGGTIGISPGAAATGAATGGATAGVNPGGGSAPGTSLGTDPSTTQALTGGATGGAQTPGAAAIGTGGTDPTGGANPTGAAAGTGSNVAGNVLRDFNELSSAARFAQSLDALTSGTQAGATANATPTPQQIQASAPSSGGVPVPSAGAQPVSQIAASAVPSGEMQAITQDYATQTENSIRADFANRGISGSPMEQQRLQGVQASATQRAQAAEQAMQQAGITDPNVFAALMVSNLPPDQFASAVARTGIT